MKNNTDIKEIYIQNRMPNWEELARLIEVAKGADRSMGDFAKACHLSPATFTRIVNGYYKKPLSDDILQAIADNSLVASVNYRRLKYANGYDLELEEGNVAKEAFETNDNHRGSADFTYIFIEELDRRGLDVVGYSRKVALEGLPKSQMGYDSFDSNSRFLVGIFGVRGYEPRYRKCCRFYMDDSKDEVADDIIISGLISEFSAIFLRDQLEGDMQKDVMYSFMFANERIYNIFKGWTDKMTVNNYMSLILVDQNKREVVKEEMLKRKDGKRLESIFDLPYIE